MRATDPDGLTRAVTFTVTVTAGDRDYDADNDNLIDVATLAQLDAVRYDLDGNGLGGRRHVAALLRGVRRGNARDGMPGRVRRLRADRRPGLRHQRQRATPTVGDDYWNDGDGWDPIGDR